MKCKAVIWSLILLTFGSIQCSSISPSQSIPGSGPPDNRQGTASQRYTGSVPMSCAEDVALDGKYAYVADGPAGVRVVNVGDPSKPGIIMTIPTIYAFRVYVANNKLYLCDGPGGLKIYTIENRAIPVLVYSQPTEWASAITFADNHLYLADYYAGLKIFPLSPEGLPTSMISRIVAHGRDVAIDGTTLVISDNVFGLVGFTHPSPTEIAWTYTDISVYSNYEGLLLKDGYCIIARNDEAAGLYVFDVSDPFTINLKDIFNPTQFICDISSQGNVLLAATGNDGILGFNMTNPTSLSLLWVIDTPGYANRAKIAGKYLYVADMNTLSIFTIDGLAGDWQ